MASVHRQKLSEILRRYRLPVVAMHWNNLRRTARVENLTPDGLTAVGYYEDQPDVEQRWNTDELGWVFRYNWER
jgi:hypothetical protein